MTPRYRISRGVEILLKKAKVDPVFRKILERSADAAAASIDLDLTATERAVLAHTPARALQSMIDRAFVPRHHVQTFLSHSAAAMLAVVLASTVPLVAGGDYGMATEGIDPEIPVFNEEQMGIVQEALEAYRAENGRYPSTEEWRYSDNPLEGYLERSSLTDYNGERLLYIGVVEDGTIVDYRLASEFGEAECPIDPERHRFPYPMPVKILSPGRIATISAPVSEDNKVNAILKARHDRVDAVLTWYLDGLRIAETRNSHVAGAALLLGDHELLVVDDRGYYDFQTFTAKLAEP